MTTSLRSLLGSRVEATQTDIVGRTAPIALTDSAQTLIFGAVCTVVFDATARDTNCYFRLSPWIVPAGTTEITFEIWGGGGGGAGACCCEMGVPGGSGAYARKTVTGNLANCQYVMTIGEPTCCSPCDTCGFRGSKTFITGFGLTNFCAEGGIPGCGICCLHACFPVNCCGIYFVPDQANQCACYYGADYGIPGRPSGIQANCIVADYCFYKNITAVPPELPGIASLANTTYYADRIFGNQTVNESRKCKISHGLVGSNITVTPGVGAASGATCADACVCGAAGTPGLIRVSYK